jgi:hypothetical protein
LLVGERADSWRQGGNLTHEIRSALQDPKQDDYPLGIGLGGKDFYADDAELLPTGY